MAKASKINFSDLIIFLILVSFPFGQLFRVNFLMLGKQVPILGLDILAALALIWVLVRKPKLDRGIKLLLNIYAVFVFSYLFSFALFAPSSLLIGFLYLARFGLYLGLFILIRSYTSNKPSNKSVIVNSLIIVAVITALLGWIQYFVYPDFRPFVVWGWDDHLNRLIGTFFDPGFTGIILTLGVVLAFWRYLLVKRRTLLLLAAFLVTGVLFTYSRASILAVFTGVVTLLYFVKKQVKTRSLYLFLAVIIGIVLLPKAEGAGVNLARTFSVYSRVQNYKDTLFLWRQSPLFGLGFNNLCVAKDQYLDYQISSSHSCSGSDSSLLLLLATTGVVGMIIFIDAAIKIIRLAKHEKYRALFLASLGTVALHSLFVNSLFYPFVVVWMLFLFAFAY